MGLKMERPWLKAGGVRLLTSPFVVFINPPYTPKADFPLSSFLRRTWMFAPRRRARMPVRRVKKGRGFQGDAAAWASPWSGRERLAEVAAVRGRGEAPRLYSCFRSLLLFQRPWGTLSTISRPRLKAGGVVIFVAPGTSTIYRRPGGPAGRLRNRLPRG